MKKDVLRNFVKFTGKHLCQSLFFNKVADLRPATLLKKRLWHRRFPVNFAKFLRTPFLQNTSGRLQSDWRSTLLFRSFTKANFELLNNNLHDLRWLTWLAYNNSAKLPPLHRPWNLPRLVEHSLLRAFVVLLLHTQFWFDHVLFFSVIGTL